MSARFPASLVLCCLLATLLGASNCAQRAERNALAKPAAKPLARLASGKILSLEVRRTPDERALGLMFRENLSEEEGMLFVFPEDGLHAFWMKNMRFSIDILWLDARGVVVHAEESVPPCPDAGAGPCPSYAPPREARYVLEIPAGAAARNALRVGSHIALENLSGTPS
ncbi:MAG: DUF192 domain-containing protein [Acidobacteriota bacterium]|nr:MAG: DUF192 domain-containing protein [Acidobacteriota bacterium]